MRKTDMLGLLQEHGAVIAGHFELASGLHSAVYVQTALVLQYPHVAQKIAKGLLAKFPAQKIDVIIAPAMSSVVLGQELARLAKCRAIFAERNNGMLGFRRDFKIERGERALIVHGVLTTGRLTAELVSLVQAYGAKVAGVGAIVDRSTVGLSLCVPVRTMISYPLQAVPPADCLQCAAGTALSSANKRASGAQEGE